MNGSFVYYLVIFSFSGHYIAVITEISIRNSHNPDYSKCIDIFIIQARNRDWGSASGHRRIHASEPACHGGPSL